VVDSSVVNYLLGGGGTAALTLVLILTGVLVTKKEHDRVTEENDRLQKANDALIRSNEQLREANIQLGSSGQLTNQVMTALVTLAADRQAALLPPAGTGSPGQPGKTP
jgi:hypothetical protein